VAEDLEELSSNEDVVQRSTSSPSTVVAVGNVAQVATPGAQLTAAAVGSLTVAAASLQSFIASLKLTLEESLIASTPLSRVSRL
jgi:hypothetical protein